MQSTDLPAGWEVWSVESQGPTVLVYRSDIFDTSAFPAECMPTMFVSQFRDPRKGPTPASENPWQVELRLEPAILLASQQADDREAAIAAAMDLGSAFINGEFDIYAAYGEPRECYLAKIESLIERDEREV